MMTSLYSCGAIRALAVLLAVLMLGGLLNGAPSAYAASAPSKKEVLQAVSPSVVTRQETASKRLNRKPKQIADIEKAAKTPPSPAARMARRRIKTRKPAKPVPMVQPKQNLSYYGILEPPQRYSLSREPRRGQLPTPQTGELLHEHFLELDKNHDGLVDPFERSFGRLDIDRDLSNHQWE